MYVRNRKPWAEPRITINGHELSVGQAMAVRVALNAADWDCGYDKDGKRMEAAYRERAAEVLALIDETTI
jgi:hypothetical protein